MYAGGYDPSHQNAAAFPSNGTLLDPPALLPRVCPLFRDYPMVCCNSDSIDQLKTNTETLSTLLGNCLACVNNVIAMWCAFACRPDQDMFITSVSGRDSTTGGLTTAVFNISIPFLQDVYDSCKDTVLPGGTSFNTVFGTDPISMFHTMAVNRQNAFRYMNATYINAVENSTLFTNTIPCSDQCACSSCKAACVNGVQSPLKPIRVWGKYDPIQFGIVVAACAFAVIIAILIAVAVINSKRGFHVPCDDSLLKVD